MRRLTRVLSFALLAVCLSPLPAHAYFWEWLDSLSGPKFGGGTVELKIWCVTDRRTKVLEDLRAQMETVLKEHATEYESSGAARTPLETLPIRLQFIRRGTEAARLADKMFQELQTNLGANNMVTLTTKAKLGPNSKAVQGRTPNSIEGYSDEYDAGEHFWEALQWRDYALAQFAWADRARSLAFDDGMVRAASTQRLPLPRFMRPARVRLVNSFAVPVNASASICSAGPIDRHKQALNVTYEFASDRKAEYAGTDSRMHKVGVSYHFILAPWVSVGFGGGRAFFKSDGVDWFGKYYVEPHIVDVRPLAIGQHKYSTEAWRQVFYLRVNSLWFVNGFEAGRFGRGTSPKLGNELITSIGIHADVSPVIRKARRRW
jgi:hypothetical protein